MEISIRKNYDNSMTRLICFYCVFAKPVTFNDMCCIILDNHLCNIQFIYSVWIYVWLHIKITRHPSRGTGFFYSWRWLSIGNSFCIIALLIILNNGVRQCTMWHYITCISIRYGTPLIHVFPQKWRYSGKSRRFPKSSAQIFRGINHVVRWRTQLWYVIWDQLSI